MSTSALLYPGGINPPLDGITPVFEQVGADPSLAPGLDRPPGSLARRGALYYWKVDVAATAWITTPFSGGGGGGGITNVTGTDGITVTTPVAGVKNVSNDLVTGVDVAQLNVDSLGAATIDAVSSIALTAGTSLSLTSSGAGDIVVNAARDELHTVGRAFSLTAAGAAGVQISTTHASSGNISLSSAHGNLLLEALDDGTLTATSAGDMLLKSTGGAVTVQTVASAALTLTAANDLIETAGGAISLTAASNVTVKANGTGGILLDTKATGVVAANSIVVVSDEDFTVHADDDISIAADDGLTLGAGGSMLLDVAGAALTLSTQGGTGDIVLQSGDDIALTAADRIGVVAGSLLTLGATTGALFDFTAAPLTVVTSGTQITVDGGVLDFNIIGGGLLSFFGAVGAGQATHLNNITGGTVQDAEARIGIDFIKAKLVGWGLMEA